MLAEQGTTAASRRWWEDPQRVEQRWCGVFKGGGAKGIAYVGALEAVAQRKVWFSSVAGSSAGALTATLIAAGIEPAALHEKASEMLSRVERSVLGLALGGAWPLYSLGKVGGWLRELLVTRVSELGHPVAPGQDVTFEHLYRATGIELNVVVMDLATSQPVVMNHVSTPDCAVHLAAVASSSIPVVFSSGRLLMLPASSPASDPAFVVHRVVDGGAWANYPRFVYADASFRAFHRLPALPEDARVVGFVLENGPFEDWLRPYQIRPDLETDDATDSGLFLRKAWPAWVLRRLDKTSWRLAALVVWPLLSTLVTLRWLWEDRSTWQRLVAAYGPWLSIGKGAFVGACALAALLSLSLAVVGFSFGRELIRVGLGTLSAALSVSTGVPYWLGADAREPVIRVPVPSGVGTTSFRLQERVRTKAVDDARTAAAAQLDAVLGHRPTRGLQTAVEAAARVPPAIDRIQVKRFAVVRREMLILSLLWLMFAGWGLGLLIVDYVVDRRIPGLASLLSMAAFAAVPLIGIWLYARGAADRRLERSLMLERAAARHARGQPFLAGEEPVTLRGARAGFLCYVVLTLASLWLALLTLQAAGASAGRGTVVRATVQQLRLEGGKIYDHTLRIDEGPWAGSVLHVYSPRDARVGEQRKVRIARGSSPEWATRAVGGKVGTVLFPLFFVASFLCGAVWKRQDYVELRRLGARSQLELVPHLRRRAPA